MKRNFIQLGAVTTLANTRLRRLRFSRRWKFSSAILIWLFLTLCYILYEVQYKTGIELLPFLPIDDSGFE
ncbi:unnamed protein product [Strongylus vulgaris]|uniref:Uncharacterized protein n=1 Tax=Strongylus vulgaris TaxID=40348 RepID=A0A3P7KCW7_STRVU|nr:unnamed protein product [Strongylus vulgaris]